MELEIFVYWVSVEECVLLRSWRIGAHKAGICGLCYNQRCFDYSHTPVRHVWDEIVLNNAAMRRVGFLELQSMGNGSEVSWA